MDVSDKWFHSQLNVANDAEENMTVDFVMNSDENAFELEMLHWSLKCQMFEMNPKWKLKQKLQPSDSIENKTLKDPNNPIRDVKCCCNQ